MDIEFSLLLSTGDAVNVDSGDTLAEGVLFSSGGAELFSTSNEPIQINFEFTQNNTISEILINTPSFNKMYHTYHY